MPAAAETHDNVPHSFVCPESKLIERADYFPETMVLRVEFKKARNGDQGKRYDYSPVEMRVWEEFLAASSKGSFFGTRIRPMWAGRLVK